MSRVDCSNVELGGGRAFPLQSFIVGTAMGILTLKLEMEMKWNWGWVKQQQTKPWFSFFFQFWGHREKFGKYTQEVRLVSTRSYPASEMTFKIGFLLGKVQRQKKIYFICNSFDVSGRWNLLDGYPDWKLSKESYERIFIKRGILSSVK